MKRWISHLLVLAMMFSLCSGISVTASADEQDESTSPAETSAPAEGPVAEGSSAELTAEGPAALFDCFFIFAATFSGSEVYYVQNGPSAADARIGPVYPSLCADTRERTSSYEKKEIDQMQMDLRGACRHADARRLLRTYSG